MISNPEFHRMPLVQLNISLFQIYYFVDYTRGTLRIRYLFTGCYISSIHAS